MSLTLRFYFLKQNIPVTLPPYGFESPSSIPALKALLIISSRTIDHLTQISHSSMYRVIISQELGTWLLTMRPVL